MLDSATSRWWWALKRRADVPTINVTKGREPLSDEAQEPNTMCCKLSAKNLRSWGGRGSLQSSLGGSPAQSPFPKQCPHATAGLAACMSRGGQAEACLIRYIKHEIQPSKSAIAHMWASIRFVVWLPIWHTHTSLCRWGSTGSTGAQAACISTPQQPAHEADLSRLHLPTPKTLTYTLAGVPGASLA